MYISTPHSIGDTVYYCDVDGSTVTRATVAEVRITQYKHSTNVLYLVRFASDGKPDEAVISGDDLHRTARDAFSAWDNDHPQVAPADEAAPA